VSVDTKLIILNALNGEDKSTRKLTLTVPELHDRSATSLLLGLMRNDGLISKQSNGYWHVTEKGKAYLEQHGGQPTTEATPDAEPELETKPAEPEEIELKEVADEPDEPVYATVEEALEYTPALKLDQVFQELSPEDQPLPSAWGVISSLQHQMPVNAKLVIEGGSAYAVFAGSRFKLGKEGDIEALIRMAACYEGEAA
jgi:hypothetical protein